MSLWSPFMADPAKWARLASDPEYLQSTPLFTKGISDLFYNFGIQPTAQQQADYGIGPVQDNPYSVAKMLMADRTRANHGSINAANAAGLEESGAAVGALNANNENYKRNYAGAVSQLGRGVSDLLTGYTGQIGSIFDRLEQTPIPQAAQPYVAPGPAVGQATGVGTNFATPQTPYARTGPEAGGNIFSTAPKKPKGVSFATALHGAGRF